jgi:hypothetical protein
VNGDMRDFLLAAQKRTRPLKKPELPILNFMAFVERQFVTCDEQGGPQVIRIKISGHKTDSMERRHNIEGQP